MAMTDYLNDMPAQGNRKVVLVGEKNAEKTGIFVEHGPDIMNKLLEKK